MSEVAPFCPVSYSAYPSARLPANDPRTPMSRLVDQINRIPRAVDLLSAVHALNIMNNIIMQLTIGEPQVNNVYPLGGGGVILKGGEYGQKYGPEDWILEERNYQKQELVNPDDNDQVIKIRTLKAVYFHHPSAGAHLNYYGQKTG